MMSAATPERIPVVLLTGYLGAGKTTVLNHLLALPEVRGRQPVLLINEFGALGVDAQRLASTGVRALQINRGSLFCACTQVALLEALSEIGAMGGVGLLLIEATGVSETRDLEGVLDLPMLAGRFAVRANLCLVDAAHFTAVAPFLRAAGSQVCAADGLVLNKADLVTPDELARLGRLLGDMNPRAAQITVRHGCIPWSFIDGLKHERTPEPPLAAAPAALSSVSLSPPGTADREAFAAAVQGLSERLLRLKGHVRFDDTVRFVELAGGRYTERAAEGDVTATAFTAIGWGVSREELAATFARAFRGAPDRGVPPPP